MPSSPAFGMYQNGKGWMPLLVLLVGYLPLCLSCPLGSGSYVQINSVGSGGRLVNLAAEAVAFPNSTLGLKFTTCARTLVCACDGCGVFTANNQSCVNSTNSSAVFAVSATAIDLSFTSTVFYVDDTNTSVNTSATTTVLLCLASSQIDHCVQRTALLSIRKTALLTPSTWNLSSSFCDWPGVTCANSLISKLVLPGLLRSSPILPGFQNLSTIVVLDLSNNKLNSSIEALGIDDLHLQQLNLSRSFLNDTIPSPLFTSTITVLDLSINSLTGSIPSTAQTSVALTTLDLSRNKLTGAVVLPASFPGATTIKLLQNSGFNYDCPITVPTNATLDLNVTVCLCSQFTLDNAVVSPALRRLGGQTVNASCFTNYSTTAGNKSITYTCDATSGALTCNNPSTGLCQCLPNGCDGIGGSALKYDVCGRCGGTGFTCAPAVVRLNLLIIGPSSQYVSDNSAAFLDMVFSLLNSTSVGVSVGNLSFTSSPSNTADGNVTVDISVSTTNEHTQAIIQQFYNATTDSALNATGLASRFNLTGITSFVYLSAYVASSTDPTTTPSSSSSPIIYIAIACGAGGGLVLIILIVLCRRRSVSPSDPPMRKKAPKEKKEKKIAVTKGSDLSIRDRSISSSARESAMLFASANRSSELSGLPASLRSLSADPLLPITKMAWDVQEDSVMQESALGTTTDGGAQDGDGDSLAGDFERHVMTETATDKEFAARKSRAAKEEVVLPKKKEEAVVGFSELQEEVTDTTTEDNYNHLPAPKPARVDNYNHIVVNRRDNASAYSKTAMSLANTAGESETANEDDAPSGNGYETTSRRQVYEDSKPIDKDDDDVPAGPAGYSMASHKKVYEDARPIDDDDEPPASNGYEAASRRKVYEDTVPAPIDEDDMLPLPPVPVVLKGGSSSTARAPLAASSTDEFYDTVDSNPKRGGKASPTKAAEPLSPTGSLASKNQAGQDARDRTFSAGNMSAGNVSGATSVSAISEHTYVNQEMIRSVSMSKQSRFAPAQEEPQIYGNQEAIESSSGHGIPPPAKDSGMSKTTSASSLARSSSVRDQPTSSLNRTSSVRDQPSKVASAAVSTRVSVSEAPEEEALVLRDPEKWTSVECLMWLKHHGFKEFVDIFYNNGFEGWHLVNIEFDSFKGLNLPPARVNLLLDMIKDLKFEGSWTVPSEKDQKPPTPEPVPAALASPPPLAAMGRLNSVGSNDSREGPRRSASVNPASRARVETVAGFALPDTTAVEVARMKYCLTLELSREDGNKLLHNGSAPDGEYLIRSSKRNPGNYVLCVVSGLRVHHFEIFYRDFDKKFCTSNGLKFASLELLVEHFKKTDSDGVPCKLTFHCRHYDRKVKEQMDADERAAAPQQEVYEPVDDLMIQEPAPQVAAQEEYEVIVPETSQVRDFKKMLKKEPQPKKDQPKKKDYVNQVIIDANTKKDPPRKPYENQEIVDQNQQYMPPSAVKMSTSRF